MKIDDYIKLISDNLPLLASSFFVAGLIKVYVYYKLFGIYIFEFIDAKEVLTLYVSNLLTYFVFILLCLFFLFLKASVEASLLCYVWLLAVICSISLTLVKRHIYAYETVLWNLFVMSVFASADLLNFEEKMIRSPSPVIYLQIVVFLILSMLIFSIIAAYIEYKKVKNKSYFLGTIVDVDGVVRTSTVDNFYIGKTEGYVFFHTNSTNTNEVIPVSKISKFTFTK